MDLLQLMSLQTADPIFKMMAHTLVFWLPHQNTVIQERMGKKWTFYAFMFSISFAYFLGFQLQVKIASRFPR